MDRCRCSEYMQAVEKVKFYTVGTLRPDIIEKFNRTGYDATWIKHGVDYTDLRFSKPRARKILAPEELPENRMSKESRNIEQMWCPYMTPIKI